MGDPATAAEGLSPALPSSSVTVDNGMDSVSCVTAVVSTDDSIYTF